MDHLNVMKIAIDYIENHLAGEIDYRELERLVGYSLHHFQRIFCVVTDFSLGEYIRRRRMTTAAFELQKVDVKIIDLAMKYGYDSPSSFTRSF